MRHKIRNTRRNKFVLCILSCILCIVSCTCLAQGDLTYRISLILSFQTENSVSKLDAYSNAHDFFTASKISLNQDASRSLDFYEGALQALNEWTDSVKIELNVFDNDNNDSLTSEILQNEVLKKSDVIIGSVSSSSAKLVADFCKQNQIVNIQPFTPSKSLTENNPYHLKLAPTIDAHIETMFSSIVDSFAGGNVVIYTPDVGQSIAVANQIDWLFFNYNQTAERKFSVCLLNSQDLLLNGKKTSVREQLKADKKNILILTSFDESFVNNNLRILFSELNKYHIVVYGMPTWLSGEVLRLDYVNDFSAHLTDPFFIDSSKTTIQDFVNNYATAYDVEPSEYAYLGYDVMNFTLQSLRDYGKDFLDYIATQRYLGAAYKFDIVKVLKDGKVNYFENRYVHVFKVQDYQLKKVW